MIAAWILLGIGDSHQLAAGEPLSLLGKAFKYLEGTWRNQLVPSENREEDMQTTLHGVENSHSEHALAHERVQGHKKSEHRLAGMKTSRRRHSGCPSNRSPAIASA